MEEKHKHKNALLLYRKRMGFSQKYVARLLGHKTTQMLSGYERGHCIPSLATALRLEIIYRVPVAFLYGRTYDAMREQIREKEERFAPRTQQALF
jgi:transcriptional regulator with XRE-family HTH domain